MSILKVEPQNPKEVEVTSSKLSFGDRFSAGWRAETVRTDAYSYAARVRDNVRAEIFDRLPTDAQTRVSEARKKSTSYRQDLNEDDDDRALFDEVGRARAANSLEWQSLPGSVEELEAETVRRRKDELSEAEDLLGLDGGGVAGFFGTGARAMTDETSLMLMPFGAGGSLARVVASEAILGAVGEAAVMPREFRVADELDLEDPNILPRLAMGAAFGGAIGGGLHGAGRLLKYSAARRDAVQETTPDGVHVEDHAADVDKAYERLASNEPSPTKPETIKRAEFVASERASADVAISYELGKKVRNKPLSDDFVGKLRGVVAPLGDDIGIIITSGGQDAKGTPGGRRTGSTRHDVDAHGHAHTADLVLTRNGRVIRPGEDKELYARFFHRAAAEFPGLGHYAWGVHVGKGTVAAWGPTTKSASLDPYFGKAIDAGRAGWNGWTPKANAYRAADPDAGVSGFTGYGTSRAYTSRGQVLVGDDLRIDVEYEVIDLARLRQASGELQPRDRGRAASDAWVSDTAARLDPAQLMPAPTADRGTPLVGPDGVIESGNGRVRAIKRAYDKHPDRASVYRQEIELITGETIPEGVAQPVLIARRKTELDQNARRSLVVDAQDSGVARMNATERAQIGQRALNADVMGHYRPGAKFSSAENRNFARAFAGSFPRSERNSFFDQHGALSIDGVRQLQDAMFARAYDAPDILARYVETEAGELRSLMDALSEAAPDLALLRSEIDAGLIRSEMDITPFVLDAARLIMTARDLAAREGSSAAQIVEELLGDIDMLDGVVAPLTQALVRRMMPSGRQASAEKVAAFLKRYVAEARKSGRAGDALGDLPGPLDVLKAIDKDTFGDLSETGAARLRPELEPEIDTSMIGDDAFIDGAHSPEARAGDFGARATLEEPSSAAPFGPVFSGFTNDPKGAISKVLSEKTGEVPDAVMRSDIGQIAIVYGNNGMGLRHIQRKHPEIIDRLPVLLRDGEIVNKIDGDRVYLQLPGDPPASAVIRLNWDGHDKIWLVTAFDDERGSIARQVQTSDEPPASASSRIPDATEQNSSSTLMGENQGSSIEEMRRATNADDLTFEMPDGTSISAREFLDDLDADETLEALIDACTLGRAG